MNFNIYVNGLESLSGIEFYTAGEMHRYILASYWLDGVGEVDICCRVYNPDDEAENIITWTSKEIAEEKRKAIEFQLADIAEKGEHKKAIGLENPNDKLISLTEINISDHEYSFEINRDTWYDFNCGKISQ